MSSSIPPPLEFVPLREWKNIVFWKPLPSGSGSTEAHLGRPVFAVFLNEMVNRDIITGRYLEQTFVFQIRENKPNIQLTRHDR